jgi:hypothetical protein
LLLCSAVVSAQDSGPGPIEGGTSQTYDVTILKMGAVQTGTFVFDVTIEDPMEEPTTSIITTGTFTSTVGADTSTGTWYAIDIGSSAIWFANAQGTAGTQVITGIATPDAIVGRIVTQSSTSTGRGRLLRALFNSSIFFGTAAETEPPTEPMEPTDPMTTAN